MNLVDVRNLSYTYPDGTVALRHVRFDLAAGECVGLIGPNGAGKSTLLWHLNGLLPERGAGRRHPLHRRAAVANGQDAAPHHPPVRIAGREIVADNLPSIRRTVGLLFQDPDDQLFCPTVREDVAFGPLHLDLPREEVLRRVREALTAVDLAEAEHRPPHHLSLGERRRVCLAGVLACQPELLVLDEPTANLDPRSRRQLLHILGRLECAKLIASHDLEMILALCSRVILLDGGTIQADGPTRQILADGPLLERHGLELPASLS